MPISKKILDEIAVLDATQDEKDLLLRILIMEDSGVGRYKKEYESAINAFIKAREQEDNE